MWRLVAEKRETIEIAEIEFRSTSERAQRQANRQLEALYIKTGIRDLATPNRRLKRNLLEDLGQRFFQNERQAEAASAQGHLLPSAQGPTVPGVLEVAPMAESQPVGSVQYHEASPRVGDDAAALVASRLPPSVEQRLATGEALLYGGSFEDWRQNESPTAPIRTFYRRGEYFVHIQAEGKYSATHPKAQFRPPIAVAVDARKVSGSNKAGYGLFVGATVGRLRKRFIHHVFLISGIGNFSYQIWPLERPLRHLEKVQDWSHFPAIVRGNATNRLVLTYVGNRLCFYANGRLAFAGTAKKLPQDEVVAGIVTLVSRNEGPDVRVAYRGLKVASLET